MAHNPYGTCGLMLDENASKFVSFDPAASDSFRRKCKMVCTIGPASDNEEMLGKLIDQGLNIARLNFSHASIERSIEQCAIIKKICEEKGKKVGILLDTKGPEIRTGKYADPKADIEFVKGQDLILTTDYSFAATDSSKIAISYENLPNVVQPGDPILVADGALSLKVKSANPGEKEVVVEILNTKSLGQVKNANLPGRSVDLPILQEKDVKDIMSMLQHIQFIAASFVQSAEDVKTIRKTIGMRGRSIKIISKIENQEGIKMIDEIIRESDGIMVARGDMGMEIDIEKVGLVQKMIIRKCQLAGKPVITATEMLDSMQDKPRPTRAEATDVLNAVLDGTDAVMLSGESAKGNFPEESVAMLRKICEQAEGVLDYKELYSQLRTSNLAALTEDGKDKISPVEAVCSAAVMATVDANCKLIVVLTETGHTARMVAKYRPACPILAITANETVACQMGVVRGVVPVLTGSFVGTDSVINKALKHAKAAGMVADGDLIAAVHGQQEESPGHTNLMKVMQVESQA